MADLVDSAVYIDLERRGMAAADALRRIPEQVFLAAITASELLVGVHLADSPNRRQSRLAFGELILDSIPVVPFDLHVARMHARLLAELRMEGITVGLHDLEIAATALAHGLELDTYNFRDFEKVPGLVVKGVPE